MPAHGHRGACGVLYIPGFRRSKKGLATVSQHDIEDLVEDSICSVLASDHDNPANIFPDQVVFLDAQEGTYVEELGGMNLYFLHAVGWGVLGRVETAFTYVIHYEDGTRTEAPCRNFNEVWDWYYIAATEDMAKHQCYKGWANSVNRGLYIWQWQNPNPEKRIQSLDIISASGQQIPLIVAITVEAP